MPGVVAVALLALFVNLGFWQLRRADEARLLQTAVAMQAAAAPLDLATAATAAPDALRWRRAEAHGRWENRHVLLDNQVASGQAGYFVYTPLRIDGCACAVLVNRGWIAAGADRRAPPDVGLPAAAVAVVGTLAPPPALGFGGGAAAAETLAPGLRRVQRLDIPAISSWLGVSLLPLTLRLDPGAADGYRREWLPPPERSARHVAYAVQWFLMALLSAGLPLGLNLRRNRQSNGGHPQQRSPSWKP